MSIPALISLLLLLSTPLVPTGASEEKQPAETELTALTASLTQKAATVHLDTPFPTQIEQQHTQPTGSADIRRAQFPINGSGLLVFKCSSQSPVRIIISDTPDHTQSSATYTLTIGTQQNKTTTIDEKDARIFTTQAPPEKPLGEVTAEQYAYLSDPKDGLQTYWLRFNKGYISFGHGTQVNQNKGFWYDDSSTPQINIRYVYFDIDPTQTVIQSIRTRALVAASKAVPDVATQELTAPGVPTSVESIPVTQTSAQLTGKKTFENTGNLPIENQGTVLFKVPDETFNLDFLSSEKTGSDVLFRLHGGPTAPTAFWWNDGSNHFDATHIQKNEAPGHQVADEPTEKSGNTVTTSTV